jgi:hypothetical protein
MIIYQAYPGKELAPVSFEIDDSVEGNHVLRFELSGKQLDHTLLDHDGRIVDDRVVTIKDFSMYNKNIDHVFNQATTYHHDHNGTTDAITQRFYGTMGCNGTADMRFRTPVFLWLLESM